MKAAKAIADPVDTLISELEELELLADMAAEESEELVIDDAERLAASMAKGIDRLEFQVMLGGPNDRCNAFLAISAGAGGVDSCDFAEMLYRMYRRWAERQGFDLEEVERSEEPEAGIRSATLRIIDRKSVV